MSETKGSRTRAGSVAIRAVGRTVGAGVDKARQQQHLRDIRVQRAQRKATETVREVTREGLRNVNAASETADRAVRTAQMRGNRAVGAAKANLRAARDAHASVAVELAKERRLLDEGLKGVRQTAHDARREVIRQNPRMNYQAGRPYTPQEMANIRSGGRTRRVFENNELYRKANIRQGFENIARMQREAEGAVRAASNVRAAEDLAATARGRVVDAVRGLQDARSARTASIESARLAKADAVRTNARLAREAVRDAKRLGQQAVREAATVKGALNRGLVSVADKARALRQSTGGVLNKAGEYVGKINPFNKPGGAPGKHKVLGFFGRLTDRALGAGPRMVEGFGKKVFTTRTAPGRVMRGFTKATGGAAGFAVSTWIDAGVQAYDFLTDPSVRLGDVGKETVGTVEGFQVVRRNPGWWDTTLGSSEYWSEVVKGGARAVTFGFFGNGEAGQGLFESDAEFAARKKRESDVQKTRWLNGYDVQTGKPLVDRNTGEDISAKVSKIRQATRDQTKERTLQAQLIGAFDPRIKYSQQTKSELRTRFQGFNPDNLNFEMYAAMIDALGARRQKALEEMESNVANFEQFAAAQPERVRRHLTTAEAYRGYRTKAIEKEYSENMGHMLANTKLAGELADHRRDALYLGVTGRNYRDDVNAQLKGEDDTFFREFNKEWGGMSLEARALYDVDKEIREYEAAEAPKEPTPAKMEGK